MGRRCEIGVSERCRCRARDEEWADRLWTLGANTQGEGHDYSPGWGLNDDAVGMTDRVDGPGS